MTLATDENKSDLKAIETAVKNLLTEHTAATDTPDGSRIATRATDEQKIDVEKRMAWFDASTIELDRHGTIVLPEAFAANLATYQRHPVFVAAHQPWVEGGGPTQIGTVPEIEIKKDRVHIGVVYARHDTAEQYWQIAKDPTQTCAVSIGFRPRRWMVGTTEDLIKQFPQLRAPLRRAKLAPEKRVTVFTEIELCEISQVTVPSNPAAVQRSAAAHTAPQAGQMTELAEAITNLTQKMDTVIHQLTELQYTTLGNEPEAMALSELARSDDNELAVDGDAKTKATGETMLSKLIVALRETTNGDKK